MSRPIYSRNSIELRVFYIHKDKTALQTYCVYALVLMHRNKPKMELEILLN